MARWEHGRLGLILGILATAGCIRSAPELPSRPEGAVISGQVVQRGGPSGDWVPATGVSVTVAGLGVTASTNADGAFRLERLPVNHIMTVRLTAVRTSTDAPIQRRVLDPVRPILDRAALDLGTLRLGPGGDLTGRALVRETAEGAAAGVGGTLVVLTQTAFKAVTDEAGHFQLPDLPEGNFDLVAFRPGYLPARQGGVAVLPGGTVTAKDLILQRGDAPDVVVSGSARILGDASDTGHSGITVRFAVDGAETPSAEVTTGPDGRYAVSLA
ncbi:MAG: carboxypeptidase regulatory-like domain-containing protein, partial [Myxococcales bacterium]|nr:carboxypeptidase regulatory-like domain-containing protein [Myxococcales bacterium]